MGGIRLEGISSPLNIPNAQCASGRWCSHLDGVGVGREEGVNADDKPWSSGGTPAAHSYACSLEMGETDFTF